MKITFRFLFEIIPSLPIQKENITVQQRVKQESEVKQKGDITDSTDVKNEGRIIKDKVNQKNYQRNQGNNRDYTDIKSVEVSREDLQSLPIPYQIISPKTNQTVSFDLTQTTLVYPFTKLHSEIKLAIYNKEEKAILLQLLKTHNIYYVDNHVFSSYLTKRKEVEYFLKNKSIKFKHLYITNNSYSNYWTFST
jgi:hypothetical protein